MNKRSYLVQYRIGTIEYRYAAVEAPNSERAYLAVKDHFKKNSLITVLKTGTFWNRNSKAQADIDL